MDLEQSDLGRSTVFVTEASKTFIRRQKQTTFVVIGALGLILTLKRQEKNESENVIC